MLRRLSILLLALLVCGAAAPQKRLAGERSRYLIEHADNRVDWYPWGAEAFAKAQKEGKPVFLSIGYASCHWCHVMERESFDNPQVADILNAHYVPVLVDREERPDVDATYIAFVQAANSGSAGWPANLILTPDLRPLTGSSYLTADNLGRLLSAVAQKWEHERPQLLAGGEELLTLARTLAEKPSSPAEVPPAVLDGAFRQIRDAYDRERGGFGRGAKFPQPLLLDYLLRYSLRQNGGEARDIAAASLRKMAEGGLYDHLGGGFHRYTVDAAWRLPHFEKMLYDQALLAIVYTEAWQVTRDEQFREVARGTLDYVLRELKSQKVAAFESGQDSESLVPRGKGPVSLEGVYYAWSEEELVQILGRKNADLIAYYYGVKPEGNVPGAELAGLNLLSIAHSKAMTRTRFGLNEQQLEERLGALRAKLLLVRSHRPQPFRDDKVIAGWNGLMISALARAGLAFDEPRYTESAQRAATFVATQLYDAKTRKLARTWRDSRSSIDARAEDYAYVVQGLLDAFEATFDVRWLDLAVELQQQQDALFWKGTRYEDPGTLPEALRGVTYESDSALPSVNSVSAMNLLRLGELVDSEPWRVRSGAIVRSFATRLQDGPIELPALASAYAASLATPKHIVIAGEARSDAGRALLRPIAERFLPNRALIVLRTDAARARLAQYLPTVAEMKPIDKKPTAYVCERYVCKAPTTDPEELAKLLK
ncbi:MAG TPA: thioredoxin domain-containing protein [Thermoanaerobaculia bacterium]|jgi:uncharacterized protein YyaL (SSP411 family)|nr:thioredoxin domain-containing protein [Thermoanaerobaculia bacterium]